MAGRNRDEDKLWEKVKRTVKPLESNRVGKMSEFLPEIENSRESGAIPTPASLPASRIVKPHREEPLISINRAPQINRLDEPTRRKISKGRLEIDARIDLHGMTQMEAYSRLHNFLEHAYLVGNRTVLVITGKGTRSEGILRNAVPRWLNEPALRQIVSGFHEASIPHGGSGALYVRIRRRKVK